jgi:hypothetical protein
MKDGSDDMHCTGTMVHSISPVNTYFTGREREVKDIPGRIYFPEALLFY